jgi:hypothetical protein
MANLSNGKGDNSAITKNNRKSCPGHAVNTNFQFYCPYDYNQD